MSSTKAKAVRSRKSVFRSGRLQLLNLHYNFAKVLAFKQQLVSFGSPLQRQDLSNDRTQMSLANPGGEPVPGLVHEIRFSGKISQPQSMHACALCIKRSRVQFCALAGRAAINDYP